ncbi:hypothetical protein GGG16DRAFT_55089, partial [Schizophyllum commune]
MHWTQPLLCACCSRRRQDADVAVYRWPEDDVSENLELLRPTDPEFLRFYDRSEFVFGISGLDGLLLDKHGVILDYPHPRAPSRTAPALQLCGECSASLLRNKIPRFALANNLYRGVLPSELQDITWVEEMVCSLYRTTAHVTRLFRSADERSPRVFTGNSCAHDMNIVSTASVLPRAPDDVNNMLSVIFVGPGKFRMSMLGCQNMFRFRKSKAIALLKYLHSSNRLYHHIPMDYSIFDKYPDDDTFPGLDERIILD